MRVEGPDGFVLDGSSSIAMISRDPLDLVAQTVNANHQYPDGFVLFLGTLFAPVEDRDEPGRGFTHKVGAIVRVSSGKLGTLVNTVVTCEAAAPWDFGITALMRNLASRGLLGARLARPREYFMKLTRVGALGAERPALIDGNGKLHDLSAVVADIAGDVLNRKSL